MGACLWLAPPSGEKSRAGGGGAGGVVTVGRGDGATGTGSEHFDASAARRCHLLDVLQQLIQCRNIHRLGRDLEGLKGAGPRTNFIHASPSPSPCASCCSVGEDTGGGGAGTHHRHKAQVGSGRGRAYCGRGRGFSSRGRRGYSRSKRRHSHFSCVVAVVVPLVLMRWKQVRGGGGAVVGGGTWRRRGRGGGRGGGQA